MAAQKTNPASSDSPRATIERDGTIRIRLGTTYAVGDVNCFVLPGSPLTLLDAGHKAPSALEHLEAGLQEVGLRVADIEQVLLTHHHADHVGLAHAVRERSGCVVSGQRMLLDYLTDVRAQRGSETEYHLGVMQRNGAPPDLIESHRALQQRLYDGVDSVEVSAPFDDGAVIEAGGRLLTALIRPGHSATDTVFLDAARGVAFVGDHLLRDKSSDPLVWRPPLLDPDPGARTSVLAIYRDAMAATARLDVDLMHAGHGEPIEGHAELVGIRLREHEKHSARALRELSDRPQTAFAIARTIWGGKVEEKSYDLISMVLGSLDLLAAEGRAASALGDGDTILYTAS
jgi:glyoxylase-like metal-dependent hydrolase (beta-lactamase superfamily II)